MGYYFPTLLIYKRDKNKVNFFEKIPTSGVDPSPPEGALRTHLTNHIM